MSNDRSVEEPKLVVRLSPALLAQVDEAARARGLRRSEFVRQALSSAAESVLGTTPQPSLFDRLSSDGILGRFSGPSHLSTTPRVALRDRIRRRDRQPSHSAYSPRSSAVR